jgi:hypothetical protein
VFSLREKGCEARGDCFINATACATQNSIDHSITVVGYGTDPVKGDYWIMCVSKQPPPPPPPRARAQYERNELLLACAGASAHHFVRSFLTPSYQLHATTDLNPLLQQKQLVGEVCKQRLHQRAARSAVRRDVRGPHYLRQRVRYCAFRAGYLTLPPRRL